MDDACASRAAEVASALQSAFALDVPAASRPTVSQWPVPQASHPAFDVCKRVLPRESMCTAGEARTHGACVTSVLCTRVLVCKAQSSERRRGSGEAKPGARHASLCAFCLLWSKL